MFDTQLSLFYNNYYFDSGDYVQPVKTLIDDKIWFAIMPTIRKDADMFVRYNKLSLQDSYVQITGDKKDSFISVSGQRESIDDFVVSDNKLVRVYFRVDPVVDTYERQVYSSGDLFAQIGGYFSFLNGCGAVLVYIFAERLLVSSLAAKLYQVYDETQQIDKYNDDNLDESAANLNQSIRSNKVHNGPIGDEENRFFKSNPVRNLIKNTMYCKNNTDSVADKLKSNKEMNDVDKLKIKNLVMARRRLNYNTWHIFEYLICCLWCRQRSNRKRWKNHLLFLRAEDKLNEQLDVVNIIRWIEQLKLMSKCMLNNKQKFWLKFQKEHLLELDANSDAERKRKKEDLKAETYDLIKTLHKGDKKIVENKLKKMINYLQHSNRNEFDQKIIQGLFKEYVSDSEDEDKAGRALNTEEEHEEFYSLQYGPGKRNSKAGVDLTGLKNLYSMKDGLVSLGTSGPINPDLHKSNSLSTQSKKRKVNKSNTLKKHDTGWTSLMSDKKSSSMKKKMTQSRVQRINEADEEDLSDTDSNGEKKQKSEDSIMDPENADFIVNAEKQIIDGKTKDSAGKSSSNKDNKASSSGSKRLAESEDEKEDTFKGSHSSSGNKINKWKDPNENGDNPYHGNEVNANGVKLV